MNDTDRLTSRLRVMADPRQLLEQLFSNSPVAYQVYDPAGHSILVNQAFIDLFGTEPSPEYNVFEDAIVEPLGIAGLIGRAFNGERVEMPTAWYDREDGGRVAISGTIFPLFDQLVQVQFVVVTLKDETEHLLAQERVEKERYKFRALFESALDGIAVIDAQRRFIDVNPAACRLFNRSAEELVGRSTMDFSAAVQESNLRWQVLESEGKLRGEGAIFRPDGSIVNIEYQTTGGYLGEHFLTILRDITERKRLEEQLRISERNYREIFDKANEAIFVVDPVIRRVVDMNAAAGALTAYTTAELRELTQEQVVSEEPGFTLTELNEWLDKAMSEGPQVFEWCGRNKNGRLVWVEISVQKTVIADEERLLIFARDISERKRLTEQLQQAQKMEAIGRLAGGVAHDFNNLLTIINSGSSMLLDGEPLSESQAELVSEILEAGNRAASLTGQLLAFSRKSMISPKQISMNEVVNSLQGMLRRLIGEDIELTVLLEPELGQVHADKSQMEQILLNLAVNARDAMPHGGKLIIETQNIYLDEPYLDGHVDIASGPYVRISFSDNGEGMDPLVKVHAFEPFFTTKGMGKGTGLGLAMTYGIVKQSGGHVLIYSEQGAGTTIKVYLPRVDAPHEGEKEMPERLHMPQGHERVLLVEDEPGVRRMTERILEICGYTIVSMENAQMALELLEETPQEFDLLLTDVVMPGMSGHQLANIMTERQPKLKVLFMSGYTDDAVVRYGVLQAKVPFLQKPFTPTDLAKKIREVLVGDASRSEA